MSSTSRPQTTGAPNIQQGQPPAKPSQVESTNQQPSVAQYQNSPNQQFIPNNIPMIQAQQLQFQSQLTNLQQTAAFLQSQFMHQQQQQQQQQPNSAESQIKNQQLGNMQNFPDLLNFFLLAGPNLNPLSQLNPSQTPVQQQQPLQTPKTVSVSPKKSGQSQHTARSATTGIRSIGVNNAQTAELNSATATSTTPSAMVSEQSAEISKQLLKTPSPTRSSSVSTPSSTLSSTTSDRLLEEVKERTNTLIPGAKKSSQDDTALSNNVTPPNDVAKAIVSSPEATKSPSLPRRKQTNVTSPIKANPIISPPNQPDSLTFSTPKKSEDVKSSSASPSTPVAGISSLTVVPPNTPNTPVAPDKKSKITKKDAQKSQKKIVEPEPKKSVAPEPKKSVEPGPKNPSTSGDRKVETAPAQVAPTTSLPEPNDSEIKSKRNRIKTNLYQAPTAEIVLATRMSLGEANKNSANSKDKLIIFFANEFIAVRNDEGSFYLCQCVHNMFKTSKKCRVRWLNPEDNSADTYQLTFYDYIDKECILTSVALESVAEDCYKLTENERERIDNILKKSIDVEKGILPRPEVTEENPDGLDISLYKDESQIKTDDPATGQKRKSESSSKSVSPAKKIKQTSKDKDSLSSRRKNDRSSVETPNKATKASKQSKKNVQPPPKLKNNEPSTSSTSIVSDADTGNKKVAKTKKQKKSSASSSSSGGPERTLRKRSKN